MKVYVAVAIVLGLAFLFLVYIDVSYTGLFYTQPATNSEWELISKITVNKNEITDLGT